MLTRIADIAEPLPRTLAWSAAWEMTREAEMKARDFVALVSGGVHAETEVGVAQRLLHAGPDRAGLLRRPRVGARARLAGIRRPAAGAGPRRRRRVGSPAGVRQRAVRFGAVAAARRRAGGAAGQRSGRAGPAGPGVDTDLRWRIVTALAAAGEIDADGTATPFIDAEAKRDPTAAGSGTPRGARRRARRRR